jgi:hypothetical protein
MPVPAPTQVTINRAPVLTLWAAVVAERLGFDPDEAVTLGRALAGLNAQSKGRRLGLFEPAPPGEAKRGKARVPAGEEMRVELMGRSIPAVRTPQGVRARDRDRPADPASARRYLEGKFKEALPAARKAMEELAGSLSPEELAERGFALYEAFRPQVPRGARGWGAAGVLDLEAIRSLAKPRRAWR